MSNSLNPAVLGAIWELSAQSLQIDQHHVRVLKWAGPIQIAICFDGQREKHVLILIISNHGWGIYASMNYAIIGSDHWLGLRFVACSVPSHYPKSLEVMRSFRVAARKFVVWRSGSFIKSLWPKFKRYIFKITATSPRDQWVKTQASITGPHLYKPRPHHPCSLHGRPTSWTVWASFQFKDRLSQVWRVPL